MEKVVLRRSGRRPLAFEGTLLSSYETSPERSHPNWSGTAGRRTEARVYETKTGRYVLWLARHTQWEGERSGADALVLVFDSLDDLIGLLDQSDPQASAKIAEELGLYEIV